MSEAEVIDCRGRALPKLSIDWLNDAPAAFQRRASYFWAEALESHSEGRSGTGKCLFLFDAERKEVYEEFHQTPPVLRCTATQLEALASRFDGRRIGVYEGGGPTGAKPGRQFFSRHPYPWDSNPYIKAQGWERPMFLVEVSPVEWPPGMGYINYAWRIEVIGDDEVIAAMGWTWQPRPRRCAKHGRRVRCPVCRGWRLILCDCPACKALPATASGGSI